MTKNEAVMTVPEAARVLRVSRGTAYDYCQRGLIPHIRLAGRIIIPKARFEAWLAGTDSVRDTTPRPEIQAG